MTKLMKEIKQYCSGVKYKKKLNCYVMELTQTCVNVVSTTSVSEWNVAMYDSYILLNKGNANPRVRIESLDDFIVFKDTVMACS